MIFCLIFGITCKPKEIPAAPLPPHLQRAVVLCFHDVGRSGRYALPLADFTQVLEALAAFRVVSLADWDRTLAVFKATLT